MTDTTDQTPVEPVKTDAEPEKPAPAASPEKKETAKRSVMAAKEEKPQDGKASDSAQDVEAKAKSDAAGEYVVKLPEGVKVDETQFKEFTGWAKEKGLTPEQASEAVAYYSQQQKVQVDAWVKQGDDWYGELEKDSEFGGKAMTENEVAVQRAVHKFDPKGELVADLQKYGIENMPSLAKFLARLGKAIGEDKAVNVDTPVKPTLTKEQERDMKMFPSHAKLTQDQK